MVRRACAGTPNDAVVAVSGKWRALFFVGHCGFGFDEHVPGFSWCIPPDDPPKHIQRRLLRRIYRYRRQYGLFLAR